MEQSKSKNSLSEEGKATLVLLRLDGYTELSCVEQLQECSKQITEHVFKYNNPSHGRFYLKPCSRHLGWYQTQAVYWEEVK